MRRALRTASVLVTAVALAATAGPAEAAGRVAHRPVGVG